ncbi:hypothetical protein ACH4YN_37950 [Streptomyces griseofuscus]|uniref:hypothetical protein n=1 Tax=Streptomyces griseofuscus TaxID=146922 RepID=UPI00379EC670
MLAAFFFAYFAVSTAGAFVGLVRIAPRRDPGLYAGPVAGTTAAILTVLALGASLYR